MLGEIPKETPDFFSPKESKWWNTPEETPELASLSSINNPVHELYKSDYVIDYKYRPSGFKKLVLVFASALAAYLIISGRGLIDNWRYWYITEYRNTDIKTATATDTQIDTLSINRLGMFSAVKKIDTTQSISEQYRDNPIYYYSDSEQIIITAPARSNIFEAAPLSLLNQALVGDIATVKLNSVTASYRITRIIESSSLPTDESGDLFIVTNDYTGLTKKLLIVIADKLL